MKPCIRCHNHPFTHAVRPPTQIQIVAEKWELWIKSTESIENIASNEHSCGTDRQNISITIVLALIMFPSLKPGDPSSIRRDPYTDFEKESAVMPT